MQRAAVLALLSPYGLTGLRVSVHFYEILFCILGAGHPPLIRFSICFYPFPNQVVLHFTTSLFFQLYIISTGLALHSRQLSLEISNTRIPYDLRFHLIIDTTHNELSIHNFQYEVMKSCIQTPWFIATTALLLLLQAQITLALSVPTHRYTTRATYRSIPQISPHIHNKRLELDVGNIAGKVAGGAAGLVIIALVIGLGSASIAVLGSVEWAELRGKNTAEFQEKKAVTEKEGSDSESDADSIVEAKQQAARQQAGVQAPKTGASGNESRSSPRDWLPTIDVKRLTRMTFIYPRDARNGVI